MRLEAISFPGFRFILLHIVNLIPYFYSVPDSFSVLITHNQNEIDVVSLNSNFLILCIYVSINQSKFRH